MLFFEQENAVPCPEILGQNVNAQGCVLWLVSMPARG